MAGPPKKSSGSGTIGITPPPVVTQVFKEDPPPILEEDTPPTRQHTDSGPPPVAPPSEAPQSKTASTPEASAKLELTPAVQSLADTYRDEEVAAITLVRQLLSTELFHLVEEVTRRSYVNVYAEKEVEKAKAVESLLGKVDEWDVVKKPVDEWLREVQSLFVAENTHWLAHQLDERLVVLGLALLDRTVAKALSRSGLNGPLKEPFGPHFLSLLTPRGQKLNFNDPVTSYPDDPATVDQLGRKAFAEALAIRLRRIDADAREIGQPHSFMLNINGPWGAGKSSLLNLLRRELVKEQEIDEKLYPGWVIVEFNAWQHQRIGLPWWTLMNGVFRQAVRQLWKDHKSRALKLWLREHLWRFRVGRGSYILLAAVIFWALFLLLYFVPVERVFSTLASSTDPARVKSMSAAAESWSKMIALVSTLGGGLLLFTRSLVSGSANAARDYMNTSRDPLNNLRRHFTKLIGWIEKPVAVFIDDLDRCQSSHVVDMIEGIQTLFRETSVIFVIAADRRWLGCSYAKAYKDFDGTVDEPGRPLGYLFLDKIFQLSASVPRMSPHFQRLYWKQLLAGRAAGVDDITAARAAAEQKAQEMTTETEITEALQGTWRDPLELQAFREAAVKRLASQKIEKDIGHALADFASLLEPNPRAMKRLINAYAIQRAAATLAGVEISREQLALWTIASLRWPTLTEYLEEEPHMVWHIRRKDPQHREETEKGTEEVPEPLRKLFRDPDVLNVIEGGDVAARLDEDVIRTCATLSSSNSGSSFVA